MVTHGATSIAGCGDGVALSVKSCAPTESPFCRALSLRPGGCWGAYWVPSAVTPGAGVSPFLSFSGLKAPRLSKQGAAWDPEVSGCTLALRLERRTLYTHPLNTSTATPKPMAATRMIHRPATCREGDKEALREGEVGTRGRGRGEGVCDVAGRDVRPYNGSRAVCKMCLHAHGGPGAWRGSGGGKGRTAHVMHTCTRTFMHMHMRVHTHTRTDARAEHTQHMKPTCLNRTLSVIMPESMPSPHSLSVICTNTATGTRTAMYDTYHIKILVCNRLGRWHVLHKPVQTTHPHSHHHHPALHLARWQLPSASAFRPPNSFAATVLPRPPYPPPYTPLLPE